MEKPIMSSFKVALIQVTCVLTMLITQVTGTVIVNCTHSKTAARVTLSGDPLAVVTSDLSGNTHEFDEDILTATFTKDILYSSSNPANEAAFDKKENFETYSIHVLARKTYKDYESKGDEDYLVVCNFQTFKPDVRGNVSIAVPPSLGNRLTGLSPVLQRNEKGTQSKTVIKLVLARIDGVELTGSIRIRSLVRLKAIMTPVGSDVGFRVDSCKATSDDKTRESTIFALGCGTSGLFRATQGFEVKGLTGLSPIFRMFQMKRRQGVQFDCTYTMCSTNCDGNTCPLDAGRKKRSERDQTGSFRVKFDTELQQAEENFPAAEIIVGKSLRNLQ